MQLQILPQTFAVCQIQDTSQINWQMPLFFFSKTAEELSLVCPETDLPAAVLQCERGWRALKICGVLDFALVGILAKISSLLANAGISIFAVSTYNTDYILIKESHLQKAAAALRTNGYQIKAKSDVSNETSLFIICTAYHYNYRSHNTAYFLSLRSFFKKRSKYTISLSCMPFSKIG